MYGNQGKKVCEGQEGVCFFPLGLDDRNPQRFRAGLGFQLVKGLAYHCRAIPLPDLSPRLPFSRLVIDVAVCYDGITKQRSNRLFVKYFTYLITLRIDQRRVVF
jgi:hypothetical protein